MNRRLTFALYLNATLMACVLVALLSHSDGGNFPSVLPATYAQNQQPIAGGAGVFIVPAQFSTNTYGCYLMDVDAQTLVAYQFMPADKQLRLVAARHFRFDRRLKQYNTQNPSPREVEEMLAREQAGERAINAPPRESVDPEAGSTESSGQ